MGRWADTTWGSLQGLMPFCADRAPEGPSPTLCRARQEVTPMQGLQGAGLHGA